MCKKDFEKIRKRTNDDSWYLDIQVFSRFKCPKGEGMLTALSMLCDLAWWQGVTNQVWGDKPGSRRGSSSSTLAGGGGTLRGTAATLHCGPRWCHRWSQLWEPLCSLPGASNSRPTCGHNLISSDFVYVLATNIFPMTTCSVKASRHSALSSNKGAPTHTITSHQLAVFTQITGIMSTWYSLTILYNSLIG